MASRICRGCRTIAEPRQRKCGACGRKLPTRPPSKALAQPMEAFIAANGGYPGCWVCRELGIRMAGKPQRDHDHATDQPRGILCPFHNRKLGAVYTRQLVNAYAKYLNRRERRAA